jgi:phage tail-like protein
MATGARVDPHVNFNFTVALDNIERAHFQEVTGLDSTIDVIEYREGGTNTTPMKLPGLTKFSNLVLKWGVTPDLELYEWHRAAVEGQVERKTGSIFARDRAGEIVAQWDFVSAWPTKYDGPDFNAEGTDIAIETLELAHEGLRRVM